jgi:hypothetical protein
MTAGNLMRARCQRMAIGWRRIAGHHEAEEVLLRTVVAPTADRVLAYGGLDEPEIRGSAAGTPAAVGFAETAAGTPRAQDLLDELVITAARAASYSLQVLHGHFACLNQSQ